MSRSLRKSRGARLIRAALLAVVALATLALAGPAVARPISHVPHPVPLTTDAALTVAALATLVALALVLGAILLSQDARDEARDRQLREARRGPRHRLA